jgi:hypothetical protein
LNTLSLHDALPISLTATLTRLATTRQKLAATIQGIENFLDIYQMQESTVPSGAFDDYLRTADELEKPLPPRGDPISRYLDQVEAEYNRLPEEPLNRSRKITGSRSPP